MIKILLIIPTLDRSGAEKQFQFLAAGLPREEFDVHVVALTRGGPYEDAIRAAGIPVTILNKRFRFDPLTLLKLRRLIVGMQPDIVHSWLFAGNAYSRLVAGRRASPKVVVSERCVDVWKSGWQLWLDRRQIARTTRLIANSDSVAGFYRAQGFPDDCVDVIRNGIAVPGEQTIDREAVAGEFNIPAGSRIVGYVGRLARQKRIPDLVWAMQLLRQVTENVYFLVVGDGPERERAQERAIHFGCDHLVRFTGHRTDVAKLMSCMDVFWLGSDFEGMSNSLMEAMAHGLPVVATDIPPNRELVVDGETGYLVPVGDGAAFCQFTDRILADRELAARLGTAGRQRMESDFSIDAMIDAHVRLYRDVLKRDRCDRVEGGG